MLREGKGREGKGKEGMGRERKGKEGKALPNARLALGQILISMGHFRDVVRGIRI